MTAAKYSLSRPLPDDVLVGGNTVWNRYQQYPVFSGPWLRGRTLLAALVIGAFSLLTAFALGLLERDYSRGLLIAGTMFLAFMLMATAGPALATVVRYRRWPRKRERRLIVMAVLVGIVLSFCADFWADRQMTALAQNTATKAQQSAQVLAELGAGERAAATTINGIALLVIYGLFGGGLALRAYFGEQRRWEDSRHARELATLREHKQRSEMRLGVLQAQVEPHFLFNTLASVRALVRQDPDRAEATLDALVDHLRATIPKLRHGEDALDTTLAQQIDICASYLALMQLRMDGRLACSIDVPAELAQHAYPPLLLITLVENAIKHGIEPKRGPGRIDVRAIRRDGQLCVSVIDDGVGLQPGISTGVGLANVRDQLATRFGDRAALRLRSLAGGGTEAEIRVPMEAMA